MMGCCPLSSKRIPSLCVSALLLPKGKENARLLWAACSGSSQHNQTGKTDFPAVEAKALGPGHNSLFPPKRICLHLSSHSGWLCSFRLLGSLGPVHQRICEKSLQPTPGLPGVTHSKVVGTSSKSHMRGKAALDFCVFLTSKCSRNYAQVLLVKGLGTISCLLEKGCFAEPGTLLGLGSPPWQHPVP